MQLDGPKLKVNFEGVYDLRNLKKVLEVKIFRMESSPEQFKSLFQDIRKLKESGAKRDLLAKLVDRAVREDFFFNIPFWEPEFLREYGDFLYDHLVSKGHIGPANAIAVYGANGRLTVLSEEDSRINRILNAPPIEIKPPPHLIKRIFAAVVLFAKKVCSEVLWVLVWPLRWRVEQLSQQWIEEENFDKGIEWVERGEKAFGEKIWRQKSTYKLMCRLIETQIIETQMQPPLQKKDFKMRIQSQD